ncbi:hypothetical protein Fmac_031348 [Flemingia macrophylla]|uniref:Uncharacterized protein n=1 Tax=Flemingia macrophylla TaxID=520843 RepID=A0ABD1L1S7_9FABA
MDNLLKSITPFTKSIDIWKVRQLRVCKCILIVALKRFSKILEKPLNDIVEILDAYVGAIGEGGPDVLNVVVGKVGATLELSLKRGGGQPSASADTSFPTP